jgi:hypothetical protein
MASPHINKKSCLFLKVSEWKKFFLTTFTIESYLCKSSLNFSRMYAKLWHAVSFTFDTWSWQNLKNIGRKSVYTMSLSKSSAYFPRFYARTCFILQSYYASLNVYWIYFMYFYLLTGSTYSKNTCRFLRAPILISFI